MLRRPLNEKVYLSGLESISLTLQIGKNENSMSSKGSLSVLEKSITSPFTSASFSSLRPVEEGEGGIRSSTWSMIAPVSSLDSRFRLLGLNYHLSPLNRQGLNKGNH